jgi:hypothetical protein
MYSLHGRLSLFNPSLASLAIIPIVLALALVSRPAKRANHARVAVERWTTAILALHALSHKSFLLKVKPFFEPSL